MTTPSEVSGLSLDELARGVAAGSSSALEAEVCRRFHGRARLYGLRHLGGDVTAAEDLAQRVMASVLTALRDDRVTERQHLDRFVLGTCRNTVKSIRRSVTRQATLSELMARENIQHTDPIEPVDWGALQDCLDALPAREKRLLVLTYFDEKSGEDIAKLLSLTTGNVRVIRHRSLGRLRECLEAKEAV